MKNLLRLLFYTKRNNKIKTKADKIRNMDNRELAESRIDCISGICCSDTPLWIGDFCGIAESKEEAIQLELGYLESRV